MSLEEPVMSSVWDMVSLNGPWNFWIEMQVWRKRRWGWRCGGRWEDPPGSVRDKLSRGPWLGLL